MWFYVLAAAPYIIMASGIVLAAIITTVILSQTSVPVEARGFYPRHVAANTAQRSLGRRTTPRRAAREHSTGYASARFSAVS